MTKKKATKHKFPGEVTDDGDQSDDKKTVDKPAERPRATLKTDLYLDLTKEEIADRARQVVELTSSIDELESEAKEVAKKYRADLEKLRRERDGCVDAHKSGKEYRNVECVQVFDLKADKTWFEYDGKEYGHRKMNFHEEREFRQKSLFNDTALPDQPGAYPKLSEQMNGDQLAETVTENVEVEHPPENKAKRGRFAKSSIVIERNAGDANNN